MIQLLLTNKDVKMRIEGANMCGPNSVKLDNMDYLTTFPRRSGIIKFTSNKVQIESVRFRFCVFDIFESKSEYRLKSKSVKYEDGDDLLMMLINPSLINCTVSNFKVLLVGPDIDPDFILKKAMVPGKRDSFDLDIRSPKLLLMDCDISAIEKKRSSCA